MNSTFIVKGSSRFVEGNPVLFYVRRFFSFIPLELKLFHKYIVHMIEIEFIWDGQKSNANAKKHGVSFEEARTAFYDEQSVVFFDPDHSEDEDRFILLGVSFKLRVLVVCHCFRESEAVVRIISARKADRDEERAYWERRK